MHSKNPYNMFYTLENSYSENWSDSFWTSHHPLPYLACSPHPHNQSRPSPPTRHPPPQPHPHLVPATALCALPVSTASTWRLSYVPALHINDDIIVSGDITIHVSSSIVIDILIIAITLLIRVFFFLHYQSQPNLNQNHVYRLWSRQMNSKTWILSAVNPQRENIFTGDSRYNKKIQENPLCL